VKRSPYWSPNAKLSLDQVEQIRREVERRAANQREIARAVGVHESTISRIATGRSWREVTQ
jgi:predicted XRE-type DNA-binding protein